MLYDKTTNFEVRLTCLNPILLLNDHLTMDKSLNLMDLSLSSVQRPLMLLHWWVIVRIRVNIHKGPDT